MVELICLFSFIGLLSLNVCILWVTNLESVDLSSLCYSLSLLVLDLM